MKKFFVTAGALAVFLIFSSATVWEGTAAAVPGDELPVTGYYGAANSFPRNTTVDVTNLENGKTVRVLISGSLEAPGLLIALSREAAAELGISGQSKGRVRMVEAPEASGGSRLSDGVDIVIRSSGSSGVFVSSTPPESSAGDTPIYTTITINEPAEFYGPPALVTRDEPVVVPEPESPFAGSGSSIEVTMVIPPPEPSTPELSPPPEMGLLREALPPEPKIREEQTMPAVVTMPASSSSDPVMVVTVNDYRLIPAEERPPEAPKFTIPPDVEAGPLDRPLPPPASSSKQLSSVLDSSLYLGPIVRPGSQPPRASPPRTAVFSAPQINSLEKGKWYVQLGLFAQAENAENVLTRIGKQYPRAVQNTGSGTSPRYHVLVGPVNKGESAALLQRFKSQGYKDAFLRSGS
ncbi:hypothetical protein AGMMS49928_17010 [Spirochaetia bacterium]|nr:hypothetical protein AGMMS49928_17010 [Spirochaetia bacterium]